MTSNPISITICTPTYNRSNKLNRLLNSLCTQDNFDFEWLIIDDGSTDDTAATVQSFLEKASVPFCINYAYKNNGGKHSAINKALDLARGELFFIVDSDDWLPNDAVSTILHWYQGIQQNVNHRFCGLAGLKSDSNNRVSGTTFHGDYIDATALQRNQNQITGEKAEIFILSILKQYRFPEFANENFLSEAVLWNQMAYDGWKIRWFNKVVYHFEYQEGGLTNNLRKLYINNPIGYTYYVRKEYEFNKWSYLKKAFIYGKVIYTLRKSKKTKSFVIEHLKIFPFEYYIFLCSYILFKLIRNK